MKGTNKDINIFTSPESRRLKKVDGCRLHRELLVRKLPPAHAQCEHERGWRKEEGRKWRGGGQFRARDALCGGKDQSQWRKGVRRENRV